MKWMVAVVSVAALGGCVSVSELEQSHETLDVISGKTPREYADCIKQKLADTRDPLVEEPRGDGLRLIVPQKISSGVGAGGTGGHRQARQRQQHQAA